MEYLGQMFHRAAYYSFTRITARAADGSPLEAARLLEAVGKTLVGVGRWVDGTAVYAVTKEHLRNPVFMNGGVIPLHARGGPENLRNETQSVATRFATIETSGGPRRVCAMENVYILGGTYRRTRWQLNVGIEERDDGSCTLAVRRSYGYNFDAESFNLRPDPGSNLWELLQTPGLHFMVGSETVDVFPQLVGKAMSVQQFVDHLSQTQRNTAVVIRRYTDLDSMRLHQLVAGHATIFMPSSDAVEDTMSKVLDLDLGGGDEDTTIYRPGQPLYVHVKPVKQRLYAWREHARARHTAMYPNEPFPGLDGDWTTPDQALDAIVANVFHFGAVAEPDTIITPADIELRERRSSLDRLRATRADDAELLRLFEEENEALARRLSSRESELRAAESAWMDATADRDALRQEVMGLKAQHGSITANRPQIEAPDLPTLPRTLLDLIDLACRLYPHRLKATELARASAESAFFSDVDRAWRCLYLMATVLHPLHFKEGLPLRAIAKRFQEETGFELAPHESESTRTNERLASLRTQVYRGEALDVSTHVKVGNKRGQALRVHYAPHVIDQRIIIGHFGAHLPTGKDR
jgi:hypothetical protein